MGDRLTQHMPGTVVRSVLGRLVPLGALKRIKTPYDSFLVGLKCTKKWDGAGPNCGLLVSVRCCWQGSRTRAIDQH